ncbi:MAG: tetratricopeptide repeat protein, partial [Acidobacteria bacterium]|nr:tetratricopeptide repeat protein [Acidobacteriota bacterium]
AQELIVDIDEGPLPDVEILPVETAELPPPVSSALSALAPGPVKSQEDQEIETLVVEAEVFAKYGLTDKAVERLRVLVRRRPDLLPARERLVALMKESSNPALAQEAQGLANVYRGLGRPADAEAMLGRLGLAGAKVADPAAVSSTTASIEIPFDEFNLAPQPVDATPEFVDDFGSETVRFSPADLGIDVSAAAPAASVSAPSSRKVTPLDPVAPLDSDFVSYEELGTLLEDEMQKAGETPAVAPSPPPGSVEDSNLFADEQQFFNLAEELEKELAEEGPPAAAPAMAGAEGEASLEEIFREFKKGVEQQLSAEDYETHFNLGIAYKEMGLVDEAIGEFQLASKDPARTVECCSMLGLCFLEKGMPQLAVKWYRKGLEAGDIEEMETVGLLYDLGCVYQDTGEIDLAYRTFLEVYGLNTNYRDVVHRVRDLEAVKKT